MPGPVICLSCVCFNIQIGLIDTAYPVHGVLAPCKGSFLLTECFKEEQTNKKKYYYYGTHQSMLPPRHKVSVLKHRGVACSSPFTRQGYSTTVSGSEVYKSKGLSWPLVTQDAWLQDILQSSVALSLCINLGCVSLQWRSLWANSSFKYTGQFIPVQHRTDA